MKRRERILKDDAERLKETQERQRRRRDVSHRRPWGSWPKPAPLPVPPEELRRLDLMDVSLTLHCAALYLMAPPAQE